MFDRTRLEALLELQGRSYALVRWLDGRARAGQLSARELRRALADAGAAEDWLRRNAAGLPSDVRPPPGSEVRYANLLASYLATSLQVSPAWRARAHCAEVRTPGLRARAPSREDEAVAAALELDCLEALAAEEGLALFRDELARFRAASPALGRAITTVAYARELERRTEFRGQGRPVLALWRELAWDGTHPVRGFALTADAVLEAERVVRAQLLAAVA